MANKLHGLIQIRVPDDEISSLKDHHFRMCIARQLVSEVSQMLSILVEANMTISEDKGESARKGDTLRYNCECWLEIGE